MTDEQLAAAFLAVQAAEMDCTAIADQKDSPERPTALLAMRHLKAARLVFADWVTARMVLRSSTSHV